MIAEQFDSIKSVGFTPTASGTMELGTQDNPLGPIYADTLVAGSPDASGNIYLWGDAPGGIGVAPVLYQIGVSSGGASGPPAIEMIEVDAVTVAR
jgi:hypothetical protein